MKQKQLVFWFALLALGASTSSALEPRAPIITDAAIAYIPSAEDYYPPTAKALKQEGTVTINACYVVNGRVTSVEVAASSIHVRLNEAAMRLARQIRVKPGTLDGSPLAGCILVPVKFTLPP